MIATAWMIYSSLLFKMMKHQIRFSPGWNTHVHAVQSPEQLMWIVYHMFQDEIFTRERLCVIETFTEDVSALHGDPAYWVVYGAVRDVIDRHWNRC